MNITTNWDERLLDYLDASSVEWVSGRLPRDSVGSSTMLPENMIRKINKRGVEKFIKKVHERGLKFNYLLDGHCTFNKEYSYAGANKISEDIKWISGSGADGVTVVLPHLAEIIKKDFPNLKLGFGGSRVIWEMQRVKYFNNLGVDWIILNSATNRSFGLLRSIRNAVNCQLWLVANTGCLLFCNFGCDHDNFLSHATNYTAPFKLTDYFHMNCDKIRLQEREELIKCPWIRPEDLSVYEALGYDRFFILLNTSKTGELLKTIGAYKNRKYSGNLFDILSVMGKKIYQAKNGSIEKGAPYIDNERLEGFIDFFVNKKTECFRMLCSECGYCKDQARRALVFPSLSKRKALIRKYERVIERIEDGR